MGGGGAVGPGRRDAASSKRLWEQTTKSKLMFSTSTSPIIVDGKCIVYVDELNAYDLADGALRWHWKGGDAPYGSPILASNRAVYDQHLAATRTALGEVAFNDAWAQGQALPLQQAIGEALQAAQDLADPRPETRAKRSG